MGQPEKKGNLREEQDKKREKIVATEKEIDASLELSEQSLEQAHQELAEFHHRTDGVFRAFNEAYRRLDQMPLVIAIIVLIVYYATYFPTNWPPPFDLSATGGLVTAIAVYVITRLVFTLLKIQVTNIEGSNLDSALSKASTFGRRLLTGVRSYIPFVDEYYSGEERLQKQKTFIERLRNSLVQYGFAITSRVGSYLGNFTSQSDNDQAWVDEVSKNLSKLYEESQMIFRLAYADHENDEGARKVEWGSICKTRQMLQHFATLMLSKNLLDIPKVYREPAAQAVEYLVRMFSPLTDFTLDGAKVLASQLFSELEVEKRDFLRMMGANHIPLPQGESEEFSKLLPAEQSHSELLSWLEKHTHVEKYVLELFLLDFRALTNQRDDFFLAVKADRRQVMVLSKELLERNIISIIERDEKQRKDDISNLTDYLERISHYDKVTIAHRFSRYSTLYDYSRSILDFLKIQKICSNEAALSFETLLAQIENPETEILAQLQSMTQTMIEKHSSYSSYAKWLAPIALATLTVFLVDTEDFYLREPMCRNVAGKARAVKILYEYSWTNWDEQDKSDSERTPLDVMIKRVIDGIDRDPVHLVEFTKYLSAGYLYKRIKEIPTANLLYMERQMSNLSEKLDFKPKLEKHLKALNKVLQTRLLNTSTIMESLRMQLVGAYAITIPTRADVLSAIVRDRLPEVCEELQSTDSRYVGLFLRSEGENTDFGNYVRVGVVPFHMEFKDFANLFESAYRIALSRYEQSGFMDKGKHSIEDYVANVIRILPTSGYFRQLAPVEGRKPEDILADILKPLMIEKFGDVKTLEIIASLRVPDVREVAMKNVMTDLYDNSTNIYGIASNDLETVFTIAGSPNLADHVRKGLIDDDLKDKFASQSLSQVAKIVYQSTANSDLESSIRKTLRTYLAEICKEIRAKPSDDGIDRISSVIFEALGEIGMILNSLNA
jgi:hypothetical protein